MTDPMRDALRGCETYFKERAAGEYHSDYSYNEEMRLLVAVQAALRTPRIASDEMVNRVILAATTEQPND